LAWQCGSPNTAVGWNCFVTRHLPLIVLQICCCRPKLLRFGPHTRINPPPPPLESSIHNMNDASLPSTVPPNVEFCEVGEESCDALGFFSRSQGEMWCERHKVWCDVCYFCRVEELDMWMYSFVPQQATVCQQVWV
jgi:hypothetical protein